MRAIFEHDFLRFAALPRYFSLRSIIVGLPVLFLMLSASLIGRLPPDVIGRWVFGTAMFSLLVLIVFLTPAMFAHTLAEERKNNKLDVLRTTPVSEAGIVFGKWMSRLGLMGSMCVAALPLAAFALLFGGVSPAQFLEGTLVVFATLLWVSGVTMLASSMAANGGAAIRISYALTLGYVVLVWVISWTIPAWFLGRGSQLFGIVWSVSNSLHPVSLMTGVLFGRWFLIPGTAWVEPLLIYALASLLLTLGCLAWSIRNVRRDPTVRSRRSRPSDVESPVQGKRAGGFSRRLDLLWRTPSLWLELRRARYSPSSRGRFLVMLAALIVFEGAFLVGLMQRTANRPPGVDTWMHILPIFGTLFMAFLSAAGHGASAFHRDHDANTLEVLHAAPLSDEVLASSKIRGTFLLSSPWWLLSMAHVALGVLLGDLSILVFFMYGVASATLVAALAAFAMWTGLQAPTHQRATVRTFLAFVVHFALAPVFLGVLAVMTMFGSGGISFFFLLGYHPFVICSLPFWSTEDTAGRGEWMICVIYWMVYLIFTGVLVGGSIPRLYAKRREQNWVVVPAVAPAS